MGEKNMVTIRKAVKDDFEVLEELYTELEKDGSCIRANILS